MILTRNTLALVRLCLFCLFYKHRSFLGWNSSSCHGRCTSGGGDFIPGRRAWGAQTQKSPGLCTGAGWAEWPERGKRSKSVKPSSFSQFNQLENEEQIWIWLSVGHCSSCIYSQHGRTPVVEAVGKWRRKGWCCFHLDLPRL